MANADVSGKKTKAKKTVTTESSKASQSSDNTPGVGKVTKPKNRKSEVLAKKQTLTAPTALKKDSHQLAQTMVGKPVASSKPQSVRRSENLSSAVLETRYQTARRNPLGKVHADALERRLAGK